MDKISVIIPVYNGENYLARCIESLINQTYKNIELIFLNDGSTDKSLDILKKYQKKDKRIKIIDKANTGVSDTRNIGIEKSTGEYLCFCDCDDIYEKKYLELMYKTIKEKKVDIVKCNYQVIDTNNNKLEIGNISDIANKKYDNQSIIREIIPRCLDGRIPCFCYLIMIKKSILTVKFPLDIAMMEDVIFYLRLLLSIKNMYIIDDSLYTIMFNPLGATNNVKNYKRNILNVIKVNLYIKEELTKNKIINDKLKECTNVNTLNSISDFIFKYYLYSKENTIELCKEIKNDDFIKIVDETNLKLINIQRRSILKLIRNNKYLLLRIFLYLRKIVFKLRRR